MTTRPHYLLRWHDGFSRVSLRVSSRTWPARARTIVRHGIARAVRVKDGRD